MLEKAFNDMDNFTLTTKLQGHLQQLFGMYGTRQKLFSLLLTNAQHCLAEYCAIANDYCANTQGDLAGSRAYVCIYFFRLQ